MGEDNIEQLTAGIVAYVSASVFNAVALPPNMPDFVKRAIEAQAERERAQAGPMTMAATNTTESKEDREKKATESAAEQANLIVQAQQREREEWTQSQHSFAGQAMTGEQWAGIANDLKAGGVGQEWLLAYLIEQGQTREEAEKTAKDMQLAAGAMSKPEADRSKEEKAAMQRIEANPESAQIMHDYMDAKEKGFPPVSPSVSGFTNTDQTASTNAGADALDDQFASAPDLGQHHRAALSATIPLDAPQIAAVVPAAPRTTANAGLDI